MGSEEVEMVVLKLLLFFMLAWTWSMSCRCPFLHLTEHDACRQFLSQEGLFFPPFLTISYLLLHSSLLLREPYYSFHRYRPNAAFWIPVYGLCMYELLVMVPVF